MAIYVNGVVLDLSTVKSHAGVYYEGVDEIKSLFAGAWKEIDRKFLNKAEPVVFRTPGIKSGVGKGNQGYAYPRIVDHKTKKGKVRIAWADDMKVENGKTVYSPILRSIGINEKTLRLGEDDIEEILFMFLFNPEVVTPKNPIGRTFLEDKEADALKYEENETSSAVVSYWLFRKESPFYANEVKISTLCLAWGVNPDNKSITYKKQLLAEAVKRAEKRNDLEFNFKAFDAVCAKLKDGGDTRDVDILALIQKCTNNRIIKYDADALAWVLLGMDGNKLKTLCKVPPTMVEVRKNVLKKHLLVSPDDVHTLQSSLSDDPAPSSMDKVMLSVAIPDVVTPDFIETVLTWPDKKALYKFFGYEVPGAKLEQIHPVLIEYLVIQKRTVPFEVKK